MNLSRRVAAEFLGTFGLYLAAVVLPCWPRHDLLAGHTALGRCQKQTAERPLSFRSLFGPSDRVVVYLELPGNSPSLKVGPTEKRTVF